MDTYTRIRRLLPLLGTLIAVLFFLWLARNASAASGSAPSGATISVNTNADELNSDGDCSLREAVTAANTNAAVDGCTAGSGADTILIPGGSYDLSITGLGEDNAATGDLDIREAVTLEGTGLARIRGGYGISDFTDRVFHVVSGTSAPVIFRALSVSRGAAGGIVTDAGTTVRLEQVDFQDNHQGVRSLGTLDVISTTFGNNFLFVFNGSGAGLQSSGPTTIENSLFVNNRGVSEDGNSINGAGWAHTGSAPATINNSTFVSNGWVYAAFPDPGYGLGAAIYATSPVTASNVTFGGHNTVPLLNTPNLLEGPVRLRNTLMNLSTVVPLGCSPAVVSLGYNMSTGSDCVMFTEEGDQLNVPVAAMNLLPLTDNGGPTFTIALGPGSVAIDSGPASDCPATDQRGVSRPRDGDGDGQDACDRGAYERETPPTAVDLSRLTVAPGAAPLPSVLLALLCLAGALVALRRTRTL